VIGSSERNGGHDDQHLVLCPACHGHRVMVGPAYDAYARDWACANIESFSAPVGCFDHLPDWATAGNPAGPRHTADHQYLTSEVPRRHSTSGIMKGSTPVHDGSADLQPKPRVPAAGLGYDADLEDDESDGDESDDDEDEGDDIASSELQGPPSPPGDQHWLKPSRTQAPNGLTSQYRAGANAVVTKWAPQGHATFGRPW
jgi:hypothetical protein